MAARHRAASIRQRWACYTHGQNGPLTMLGPYLTSTVASPADQDSLQLSVIALLFLLLLVRQVLSVEDAPRSRWTDGIITIAVVPLFVVFLAVAITRSADVMGL